MAPENFSFVPGQSLGTVSMTKECFDHFKKVLKNPFESTATLFYKINILIFIQKIKNKLLLAWKL